MRVYEAVQTEPRDPTDELLLTVIEDGLEEGTIGPALMANLEFMIYGGRL